MPQSTEEIFYIDEDDPESNYYVEDIELSFCGKCHDRIDFCQGHGRLPEGAQLV
ncbi:MAG: hypothetical protein OXG15_07375 [Gammaproteobacteria bacterium]|nr:hypothetical protein [Gammaproteobacteria bacterium]